MLGTSARQIVQLFCHHKCACQFLAVANLSDLISRRSHPDSHQGCLSWLKEIPEPSEFNDMLSG